MKTLRIVGKHMKQTYKEDRPFWIRVRYRVRRFIRTLPERWKKIRKSLPGLLIWKCDHSWSEGVDEKRRLFKRCYLCNKVVIIDKDWCNRMED